MEQPRKRTLIWSAVLASLLVGFLGAATFLFVQLIDVDSSSTARAPIGPPPSFPAAGGKVGDGPWAADTPVRTEQDLEQVCESWYYPGAPKYRGTGPHPVLISVRDRMDRTDRAARTLNETAFAGTAAQREAWAPKPAKAQLVACLDLVGAGSRVRDCEVDDPDSPTLPLKEGRYRLTVYEVATRKAVTEVNLTGRDKSCPWVAMTGPDGHLYTAVEDDQLYRALRKKVER